jgi:hypothetical protein
VLNGVEHTMTQLVVPRVSPRLISLSFIPVASRSRMNFHVLFPPPPTVGGWRAVGRCGPETHIKLATNIGTVQVYIIPTETHVHKITNLYLFFYMALGLYDFDGAWNGSCPHRNHYVPRHINNRYNDSYNSPEL